MAKVLVVDDVVDNVKLLVYDLSDAGHEVVAAYSGAQALEVAERERPDVILLDIMMPGMDGIETCRRLKASPQLRAIPVILVSARELDSDIIAGLDAGATDYVTKPVNLRIVAARMRAALRSKSAHDMEAAMNRQLDDARRAAEAASLAKSEVLSGLSDALRAPLDSLLGQSALLLAAEFPARQKDCVLALCSTAERLLAIANDVHALARSEAGQAEPGTAPAGPPAPRGCILVAEDNVINQRVARSTLAHLGYTVEIAGDGREAVAAADPDRHVAILMDCHMPGMDGFEAARCIRHALGPGRQLPIIAVTASVLPGDRERCLAAGMDDYLPKPLRVEDLATMLVKWSTRTAAPGAPRPLPGAPHREPTEGPGATLDAETLRALRALGNGDEGDLVTELAGLFLESCDEHLSSMQHALEAGDGAALAAAAHALKSACGPLGARALAGCCQALELIGRAQDLQRGAAALGSVEAAYQRTVVALLALRRAPAGAAG